MRRIGGLGCSRTTDLVSRAESLPRGRSPRSAACGTAGSWFRRSRRCTQQLRQADQIIGSQCQGELPVDPRQAAMSGLRETGNGLHPGEDLLDPLAMHLARPIVRARRHLVCDIRTPAEVLRATCGATRKAVQVSTKSDVS